jgi:hypothetical protein
MDGTQCLTQCPGPVVELKKRGMLGLAGGKKGPARRDDALDDGKIEAPKTPQRAHLTVHPKDCPVCSYVTPNPVASDKEVSISNMTAIITHKGRKLELSSVEGSVPRIEKIIACTAEQCVCGNCGKENSVIGYEKSEQLDVKPAEYFVVVLT